MKYEFSTIDKKWQDKWDETEAFKVSNDYSYFCVIKKIEKGEEDDSRPIRGIQLHEIFRFFVADIFVYRRKAGAENQHSRFRLVVANVDKLVDPRRPEDPQGLAADALQPQHPVHRLHPPQGVDHHGNAGRIHERHLRKVQNAHLRGVGFDLGGNGVDIALGAGVVDLPGERHRQVPVIEKAGKLHKCSSFVFGEVSIKNPRFALQSNRGIGLSI